MSKTSCRHMNNVCGSGGVELEETLKIAKKRRVLILLFIAYFIHKNRGYCCDNNCVSYSLTIISENKRCDENVLRLLSL